ncbi:hypothetical protein O181_060576, partial [Austropuccinia psidii MF-1]|nr:hypothetical protein [Austropuccinia psidii MF-1]
LFFLKSGKSCDNLWTVTTSESGGCASPLSVRLCFLLPFFAIFHRLFFGPHLSLLSTRVWSFHPK